MMMDYESVFFLITIAALPIKKITRQRFNVVQRICAN
jgi:hypothetical protein